MPHFGATLPGHVDPDAGFPVSPVQAKHGAC